MLWIVKPFGISGLQMKSSIKLSAAQPPIGIFSPSLEENLLPKAVIKDVRYKWTEGSPGCCVDALPNTFRHICIDLSSPYWTAYRYKDFPASPACKNCIRKGTGNNKEPSPLLQCVSPKSGWNLQRCFYAVWGMWQYHHRETPWKWSVYTVRHAKRSIFKFKSTLC